MITRTQLAVLDHNCGTSRNYAVSSTGEIWHKVSYTKTTNQWVAKKMCVPKEKQYLSNLLNEVLKYVTP